MGPFHACRQNGLASLAHPPRDLGVADLLGLARPTWYGVDHPQGNITKGRFSCGPVDGLQTGTRTIIPTTIMTSSSVSSHAIAEKGCAVVPKVSP
ncbi:hypothetical protein GCM10018965_044380 [Nonomuraea roseola]